VLAGTPAVNGLDSVLIGNSNPNNTNAANGAGKTGPFRLDPAQAATADQNHAYPGEQGAFDNGLMDLFPKFTGLGCTPSTCASSGSGAFGTPGLVMGYYDGNTVTAMWNYAQHYAMSDNSYNTTFGPSTPGAINLISGQTNGAVPGSKLPKAADGTYDEYTDSNGNLAATLVPDGNGGYSDTDDDDPAGDVCSDKTYNFSMTGKNVGDLLNAKNITWGFFEGGFDLTVKNSNGTTGCARTSTSSLTKLTKVDYIPHHQPFQYYASTANPNHTRPTSPAVVGTSSDGGANHQYDIHDFFDALAVGNLPAVSFLKAPGYQDGHAGYSSPLDEQAFVTNVINTLMQSPQWSSTAVIIAYDDSDGWYDHASSIVNGSSITVAGTTFDRLAACTSVNTPVLPGVSGTSPVQGRCGYGPRLPMLVISPYAKQNFVDHTLTDQTSVLRFIEDNWLGGLRIAGSFDALAGSILNMFNFTATPNTAAYLLSTSTGVKQ
jgi:phospholipase C